MKIKEVQPITFLFYRTETSISDLINFIPVGQQLLKEAVANNLFITGPVHWHYVGFTGDDSKPFTLEISLPVSEVPKDYDGVFHFKRTELFKCVSLVHEGGWTTIPESYSKLMMFLTTHQLKALALNREIYINVDFNYPQANTTEIQIGVE